MRLGKKLLLGLLLLACLSGVAAWVFQRQIALQLLQQVAHRQVGRDVMAGLLDGLHVGLCGTGSPFPDPSRAGPCTAVIAGQRLFVVDAGEGGARTLSWMGIPIGRTEALFLTHFHSDHIDGLGSFMLQRWANRTATSPLPVHGPKGVEQVVDGFRMAYALDGGYRVAHHTPDVMPPGGSGGHAVPFDWPAGNPGGPVLLIDEPELKVSAFLVNHSPVEPAVGYRFDYKGRSVVISGDTQKTASLVNAAMGVDLLVHEALQPTMVKLLVQDMQSKQLGHLAHILQDIPGYHTTPEEAAQQASAAHARQLVFSHIVPPLPLRYAYPAFVGDAARYFSGPITVGEDGLLLSLPVGSTEITQRALK